MLKIKQKQQQQKITPTTARTTRNYTYIHCCNNTDSKQKYQAYTEKATGCAFTPYLCCCSMKNVWISSICNRKHQGNGFDNK